MLTLSFNVVNSHKSMDKKMKNKELLDIEIILLYKCSKFIVSVLKEADGPLFLFRVLII